MITKTLQTNSSLETEIVGQKIGKSLKGSELIFLEGDLGSGKTTFVKGLVGSLSSEDQVSSPSFVIQNEYKTKKFIIHHFDFYRLNEAGIIKNELQDILSEGLDVVIVEWGQLIRSVVTKNSLQINFQSIDQNKRKIVLECPSKLNYLIKNL
jgi:tRNA threonylcarbamoyladenosine biosynthesis protein TsaE